MNSEKLLEIIDTYCLSIRKIPNTTLSVYYVSTKTHFDIFTTEGCIFEYRKRKECTEDYFKKAIKQLRYGYNPYWKDGYIYCQVAIKKRVPKNAGYYMVQTTINNADSNTIWDSKKCFLAPSLEESINLFLKSTK